MPGWDATLAFERLGEHRVVIAGAQGSNEATTRLRAIDTMLFDVLGWDKLDVETELYCRAEGYADYALKDGTNICLIVEAKKSAETFVLPATGYPSTPVGFPLIAKECPAADSALRQALGYAASTGARYIAITNGFQWLIMLTFVPNQNVAERSVFVFESVDAIEKKFRIFWDCFSQQGLLNNRAANSLLETRKAPPPSKLSQRLPVYPAPASRNQIANELGTVLGIVWDETRYEEEGEEFLTQCYVEPEATAASIAQAKELLERKLSADERSRSQVLPPSRVAHLVPESSPEKPIVVLGRVGHGKSTFLRYLRKIKAKDILGKYIQLQIDFLDRPDSQGEVGAFVYGEVERQLRDVYGVEITDAAFVRGALHSDLARFGRSPEGQAFPKDSPEYKREELDFIKLIKLNRHQFIGKVVHHLKFARKTSVTLFFDNLDRRSLEIQEEAFLRASAIARDWASLVFVCLRPNTFYRSKTFGVLDSVAPLVINVVSPRTEPLVVRRLRYAKRYAEGTPLSKKSQRAPLTSSSSFHLPSVASILDCFADSFRRNSKLTYLFDAISNGNARELLSYVFDVLTSAHLDTTKILESIEETGRYIMPSHEALRAILFGNFMHYDPESSAFINLYDIQKADPMEHFSRLVALNHVLGVPDTSPTYGYCSLPDLVRYLCQLGYSEEHAKFTAKHLFEKKCFESRDPIEEWDEAIKEVRVTSLGKYHVSLLAHSFQYLDAVTVDTPILDDGSRSKITDVFAIRERLERSNVFINYLNGCSTTLTDSRAKQIWNDVFITSKAAIGDIARSVQGR